MKCRFPGIEKACVEIAYDNGGINRMRSEKKMRQECRAFLERADNGYLTEIDAWLAAQSVEDLRIIAGGEETEIADLMKAAPPFTNALLNQYFNEVC
ncbi:hypothetical protein FIU93_22565 [Labrenzia sp. THAF35]|uniref:hypothetical protein n=1 Tax=Labrenzia sp. THAF35 TaxID=2587854 RepID=UPI001267BC01|nr:hypothetical protein [Labrenzia sp. THAF35]QFT69586.1 hypothetical protein FIU93_22565 [Labrenzia sp. THAF35]